jgi:ABC-2 type transport system ATP-binding protein
MIEVQNLTKRYGKNLAVDDLSFSVEAGQVTGFLGPNGSGKSTTMCMIMGLDAPSSGAVTVGGRAYGSLRFPLHEVGALLDANAAHPGRRARSHLNWLADSNKIPRSRVDEVECGTHEPCCGTRRLEVCAAFSEKGDRKANEIQARRTPTTAA